MQLLPLAFLLPLALAAAARAGDVPKERLMLETVDAAQLAKEFPPQLRDGNKKLVHALACPPGSAHEGTLAISRWKALALPDAFPKDTPKISSVPSFFVYGDAPKGTRAWHLNFADPDLFAFYAGGLFAQDEMQVAEHPLLASVREMLLAKKLSTATLESAAPTPILVRGVQRRVKIATEPNGPAGRPAGLYGNRFARATPEAVKSAVTPITPPTVSNILALAAPRGGSGKYTRAQLDYILTAAYTGFRAAKLESADAKVEIHTGFWGCGAFGGNRTVMLALQIAAARLAEVDAIILYTGDKTGEKDFAAAQAACEKAAANATVAQFLANIESANYRWGASDGN